MLSASARDHAARPKYRVLRDALSELIDELPAGAAIPTERELCERFSVSRATVRQALDRLTSEQRIVRHQGKGTFVARRKLEQPLELTSHTEYARTRGIDPASRLVAVRRVAASTEVAERLGIDPEAEVLQIERVRLADGEALAIELLHLDAGRFGLVASSMDESQSLYDLLRNRYRVELDSAEETIEAVAAPEREADLLGIAPGSPVLLCSRQSFDAAGRPVEYVRAHYRGDRLRFRTRLRPGTSAAAALPPGTRFRLAEPDDAPALARVFVSSWRDGYPGIVEQSVLDGLDEADIADWLSRVMSSNGLTTWVVASAGEEVVAFSRHGEDPDDARRGHIYSLYVLPEAGGKGIGRALLEHSLQVLSGRGLTTVTLWVFEGNLRAQRLYNSLGFGPDGARRVEPEYGAQEIRMRRPAPPAPARPVELSTTADPLSAQPGPVS
jgi:GntR family transcriptional regulator